MDSDPNTRRPIGPDNEIGGTGDTSIGGPPPDPARVTPPKSQQDAAPQPPTTGKGDDIPVARLRADEVFELAPEPQGPGQEARRPEARPAQVTPARAADLPAPAEADEATVTTPSIDLDLDADGPLVAESWLTPGNAALAGGALTLASVLASVIASTSVWYISGPLMLYRVAAHSVAGMLALAAVAAVVRRPIGSYQDGSARVWALIALGVFLAQIPIGLVPGGIDSFVLASAVTAVVAKFMLRVNWRLLGYLAAAQLALSAMLEFGLLLAREEGMHTGIVAPVQPEGGVPTPGN